MDPHASGRRRFGQGLALAAATLAWPALGASGELEKPRIAIAVGGKAAFYHLPLTVAEQMGYFRAEGLEVEISDHPGGARALQAAVGGGADVVSGAFEHTINLQGRNQYFQAFVLQGRAPQIALGVSNRTLAGFRRVSDLRGRKIGVSAPGSSTNMAANLILARAGLKPTDVSFVGVGTAGGALAALRSGQIDAISNIDPVMTMLEQKGDVRIIADTRTLKGTREVFGGPMPAGCLFASSHFVQRHPRTCQALANAIVHALKWLQTAGPSDLIRTVPESYLLGDRALYLASFSRVREAFSPDGLVADDGARTALKALASFDPDIRADRIDLSRTYTNAFATRAKARFRA